MQGARHYSSTPMKKKVSSVATFFKRCRALKAHHANGRMIKTFFLGPPYALFPEQGTSPVHVQSCKCHTRPSLSRSPVKAVLSEPFPLFDLFSFPVVSFSSSSLYSDFRPELIGACLWTSGLYLGFSNGQRWGEVARRRLKAWMSKTLSHETADLVGDFFHSLPFLIMGFGIDTSLRYINGGNALWAVASGLSVAMYGGIYELARQSDKTKKISVEDMESYHDFQSFSERRLASKGRCHLVDVKDAARQDPDAWRLCYLSDETLRRYIQVTFPRAVRSPNGFYRGLSIRGLENPKRDTEETSRRSLLK